jgi:hypothetical protein
VYIVNNIGFNSMNGYSWTREIDMVKTMGIIVSVKRRISKSFGRPKNLFSLKVPTLHH